MQHSEDEDFQLQRLTSKHQIRRTYLVTYSQADLSKFPTRESFGQQVVTYFNEGSGKVEVQHWACCLERHEISSGLHYHLCVKLSGPKRWKLVKDKMIQNHGVVAHFSNGHDNYYSAYKYVTKKDTDVFLSFGHPNLDEIGSPKTAKCVRAYRSGRKKRSSTSTTKENLGTKKQKQTNEVNVRRLTNLEVSEFVAENKVKDRTHLLAIAETQRKEGKKDLAHYVLSRSSKALEELIENTWSMKNAQLKLDRKNKTRMQLVREARNGDCVQGCNMQWITCAREVLQNNGIHPIVFASAVKDLLTKGRGKFRNLLLVGRACTGKTFLFDPLCNLFKTFANPANDKYAWVGAEESEVIYLNDFRWSPQMISWKDFLLLLEGHIVHLPAPKNQHSSDICINTDIPVFATSIEPIVYHSRSGQIDEQETEMMSVRWRVFELSRIIPRDEQKDITACPRCFAELVLLDEEF